MFTPESPPGSNKAEGDARVAPDTSAVAREPGKMSEERREVAENISFAAPVISLPIQNAFEMPGEFSLPTPVISQMSRTISETPPAFSQAAWEFSEITREFSEIIRVIFDISSTFFAPTMDISHY